METRGDELDGREKLLIATDHVGRQDSPCSKAVVSVPLAICRDMDVD